MEKVRGFVYFEDKSLEEVKEAFRDFNIPGMRYKFFNELIRLKKKIDMPGIFIDGEVDGGGREDYPKEIVYMLRKKAGLKEGEINCDVSSSVGNEDYIIHIKKGELNGKYIGIRILPPYPDISKLEKSALNLGNIIKAQDILLRGVEKVLYKDEKIAKRCIDLIGKIYFAAERKNIEDYLISKNLRLEGYTLIDLLD